MTQRIFDQQQVSFSIFRVANKQTLKLKKEKTGQPYARGTSRAELPEHPFKTTHNNLCQYEEAPSTKQSRTSMDV